MRENVFIEDVGLYKGESAVPYIDGAGQVYTRYMTILNMFKGILAPGPRSAPNIEDGEPLPEEMELPVDLHKLVY